MPSITRRRLAALALGGAGLLAAGRAVPPAMRAASRPRPQIVRAEFLAGDVVEIDGWIVSRSQARWLDGEGIEALVSVI